MRTSELGCHQYHHQTVGPRGSLTAPRRRGRGPPARVQAGVRAAACGGCACGVRPSLAGVASILAVGILLIKSD